jgi:glycosyltransferase involved in cell wall biosynthesis
MRVAIAYDCLFPNTVGGAERWYRELALRLSDQGHQVTYLTRRQWPRGKGAGTPFEAIAVSPAAELYTESGRRRISEPLLYGWGIFWHLLRNGSRYDVVHMASFPYFSLIGAWLALRLRSRSKRPRLVVDWFEVWTRDYWTGYLGRVGGPIGYLVQRLCARLPDQSFVFSRLHERRLAEQRHDATLIRLTGIFSGNRSTQPDLDRRELVVFAGRHIPEKQVDALPAAIEIARIAHPKLRCVIFGDGPEHESVRRIVHALALDDVIDLPGHAPAEQVDAAIAAAACLVLPSLREGYGLVVVEAVSKGTPAVVVEGADNAATELIEPGVNGLVASSADPDVLGSAIVEVIERGVPLRRSTLAWYEQHADELSIESSLAVVENSYRRLES